MTLNGARETFADRHARHINPSAHAIICRTKIMEIVSKINKMTSNHYGQKQCRTSAN